MSGYIFLNFRFLSGKRSPRSSLTLHVAMASQLNKNRGKLTITLGEPAKPKRSYENEIFEVAQRPAMQSSITFSHYKSPTIALK